MRRGIRRTTDLRNERGRGRLRRRGERRTWGRDWYRRRRSGNISYTGCSGKKERRGGAKSGKGGRDLAGRAGVRRRKSRRRPGLFNLRGNLHRARGSCRKRPSADLSEKRGIVPPERDCRGKRRTAGFLAASSAAIDGRSVGRGQCLRVPTVVAISGKAGPAEIAERGFSMKNVLLAGALAAALANRPVSAAGLGPGLPAPVHARRRNLLKHRHHVRMPLDAVPRPLGAELLRPLRLPVRPLRLRGSGSHTATALRATPARVRQPPPGSTAARTVLPPRRPRRRMSRPPSRASAIRTRRLTTTATDTGTITDIPTIRERITATAVDQVRAGRGPRPCGGGAIGRLVPPDAPGVFGRRGRRPLSPWGAARRRARIRSGR